MNNEKRYNNGEVGFERRCFDVRKFDEDEGTFEAYVAIWGDVDSYGTRFTRGAFRKSIGERLKSGNIKILWQHSIGEPIGVVVGATEDDHGLLVNGRLDVGVQRADQARAQMKSGTINQMSFGFDIIKQKRAADGFIDISEVKLWEVSPVTFGANENTSVVHVRSRFEADGADLSPEEERAIDFDDTMSDHDMWRKGDTILTALWTTIDDIWWSGMDSESKVTAMDDAWEKAHAAYVGWMSGYLTRGLNPIKNELSTVFAETYGDKTPEEIALNSPLSADEIRSLRAGDLISIEARKRLAEFSPELNAAYKEVRGKAVQTLFQQIRDQSGFSQAERTRLLALLPSHEKTNCSCCSNGEAGILAQIENISKLI